MGEDGKSFQTTIKRFHDAAGNVKTYAEDSMNGRVLRKRQQHILPGSMSAAVLTRFPEGADAVSFEDEWKAAPIKQLDPFAQGGRASSHLIEGPSTASVVNMEDHDEEQVEGKDQHSETNKSDGSSSTSMDKTVPDDDQHSETIKSDGSSLTSMGKTMPDDWMVPVEDVVEGRGEDSNMEK